MHISRTAWLLLHAITALSVFSSCSNIFHDLNNQQLINAPATPVLPRIEYVYPADGSESAALNKTVLISFNKPMAMETIPAGTFRVVNESTGTPVPGSFHLYDRRLVIFDPTPAENTYPDPAQKLANQTWYQVTLEHPLSDLDGLSIPAGFTWRFKTGDSFDTVPLYITDTFPRNGDLAGPGIEIRTSFAEDLNPATLSAGTFCLTMKQHGQPDTPISGTVTYRVTPGAGAGQFTAIFRPDSTLPIHAEFEAVIKTGLTDLAGNHLERNHTWRFSTGSIIAPIEAAGNTRLGAGTFGAPSTLYGYVLTDDAGNSLPTRSLMDIFDNGINGAFPAGRYLRIVSDGKNITDPTGLNLTPTFKRLFLDRLVSPPANQCYIDTINGIFVLPRPIFWSKMDSADSIVNPEISLAGYAPIYTNPQPSYGGGKFGAGMHVMAPNWTVEYHADIYPFGNPGITDMTKGTISLWVQLAYSGGELDPQCRTYFGTGSYVYGGHTTGYNNIMQLVVNGVTVATLNNIWTNAFDHVYIVWDSAGLSDGNTVKVFVNGTLLAASNTQFNPDTIRHNQSNHFNVMPGTAISAADNFKVWNHVVTEDPSFEYNGGAGNENGLHAIYGPANNYVPDLTSPGSGVGYYYVPTE